MSRIIHIDEGRLSQEFEDVLDFCVLNYHNTRYNTPSNIPHFEITDEEKAQFTGAIGSIGTSRNDVYIAPEFEPVEPAPAPSKVGGTAGWFLVLVGSTVGVVVMSGVTLRLVPVILGYMLFLVTTFLVVFLGFLMAVYSIFRKSGVK